MPMTTKEISKTIGFTKRQLEEMFRQGLIGKPNCRIDHNRLLYSDEEVDKLWEYKFIYEVGYKIRDTKNIVTNPLYNRAESLDTIIDALKKQREKMDILIRVAECMKETGSTFDLLTDIVAMDDYDIFKRIKSIVESEMEKIFTYTRRNFEDILSDDDAEKMGCFIEKFSNFHESGTSFQTDEVQDVVKKYHYDMKHLFTESVTRFEVAIAMFEEDSPLCEFINSEIGLGVCPLIINAIAYYCEVNNDGLRDKCVSIVNEIKSLARNKYSFKSPKVQRLISTLSDECFEISMLTPEENHLLVKRIAEEIRTILSIKYDKGKRGFFWFIGSALEHYVSLKLIKEVTE